MSFFEHRVYSIKYQVKRAIREFVSQDEVRFAGHENKPTEFTYNCLAPSEEVAVAHFQVQAEHMIEEPKYEFKFLKIKETKLDAVLINSRLG